MINCTSRYRCEGNLRPRLRGRLIDVISNKYHTPGNKYLKDNKKTKKKLKTCNSVQQEKLVDEIRFHINIGRLILKPTQNIIILFNIIFRRIKRWWKFDAISHLEELITVVVQHSHTIPVQKVSRALFLVLFILR